MPESMPCARDDRVEFLRAGDANAGDLGPVGRIDADEFRCGLPRCHGACLMVSGMRSLGSQTTKHKQRLVDNMGNQTINKAIDETIDELSAWPERRAMQSTAVDHQRDMGKKSSCAASERGKGVCAALPAPVQAVIEAIEMDVIRGRILPRNRLIEDHLMEDYAAK